MAFLQRSHSRITAGIDWTKASHQTHLRAFEIEEQIISKGAPESAVAARIQVEVLYTPPLNMNMQIRLHVLLCSSAGRAPAALPPSLVLSLS